MERSEIKALITETISIIVIAVILSLILRYFVIEARIIPSESMVPTLKIGDRILVNRFIYHFKDTERGDVIIFLPPTGVGKPDEMFIKRVIGLPGETVEMKNGKVYINGKALKEPYLAEPLNYTWGPKVVPAGSILVLGDNRNRSLDSHEWGFLSVDRVKGKALLIFWPFKHMSFLERGVSFE